MERAVLFICICSRAPMRATRVLDLFDSTLFCLVHERFSARGGGAPAGSQCRAPTALPPHLTPTLSGQTLDLGPRDHRHLAQRDLYTRATRAPSCLPPRPTKNGRSRKGNVTTATLLPHQPAEAELWAKASSDLLSPHPPPPCGALVLGRMDGLDSAWVIWAFWAAYATAPCGGAQA